jgi:SAM-dependent methyltransferase
MSDVLWHDLECGAYDVDLPLWREIADDHRGPIVDIACGTGRITLDLARRGREVIGVDTEAELLTALRTRAAGLQVSTVHADARELVLAEPVELIIVPMQSVQLFAGGAGRAAFLRRANAALTPGGTLAMAIADTLSAVSGEELHEPPPDLREIDGVLYSSRPIALHDHPDAVTIERIREVVEADGTRTVSQDLVTLDKLTADELEAEGLAAGFTVLPRRAVAWSDEYIGSTVVMLGG